MMNVVLTFAIVNAVILLALNPKWLAVESENTPLKIAGSLYIAIVAFLAPGIMFHFLMVGIHNGI